MNIARPAGLDDLALSQEWHTRRPWSLWDMLRANGKLFVDCLEGLKAVEEASREASDRLLPAAQEMGVKVNNLLTKLDSQLTILGTRVTAIQVRRLIDHVKIGEISWASIGDHLIHIRSRLSDELSLIHLYVMDEAHTKYYEPTEPLLGTEVHEKFPTDARYEIIEAGKCLGLRRSTATVFHLMRTMEIGIRATARCLAIPDPVKPVEKSWGEILKALKKGIDTKWPTPANRMTGDGAFFDSVYVSLDAVKNPLRNATMHVDEIYTEEEAEDCFFLVRGFMKKLASRMDESGEPKA